MSVSELIASVYREVFSRTEAEEKFYPDNLTDPEFIQLSNADVGRYFAPLFTQETNETGYNLDQFKEHVQEVKGRPAAHFAVEILSESPERDGKQDVVIRVVATDASSGTVVGLVMSCWELERAADERLLITRNRELTFRPADPPVAEDTFATLLDPTTWRADVRVS